MTARLRAILSTVPPADLAADALTLAVMIGSLPLLPYALALLKVIVEGGV